MFSKRLIISCIASSLAMFLLSYVWHGILLTDFSRLNYSKHLFLFFAAVVYMIIGFVVSKSIDARILEKYFKRRPVIRGAIAGAACGLAFFMIATVVGISFSTGPTLENMLLDITWQTIEQTVGGIVAGLTHVFVYDAAEHAEE